AMCAVELRNAGLHVTGSGLWLDAKRRSELSFVSHAHSDPIAPPERVIATSETGKLMAHPLEKMPQALPAAHRRPVDLRPPEPGLIPAGHGLGSAQLAITRRDGHRVVYTGDFSLEPSLTAEAAEILPCDTLVIESTFGHPRFVFPRRSEVLARVEAWSRSQLT